MQWLKDLILCYILHRRFPASKAKIGVAFNVWDGEELLEFSLRSVRSQADYVVVVWSKLSWFGEECSKELEPLLYRFKLEGLIDEIAYFEPNPKLPAVKNEIKKRNTGLNCAKAASCTHFMTMDTDEFFTDEEFKAGKDFVLKHNLTHSACPIAEYKDVTHRFIEPANYYYPFLYRIKSSSRFSFNAFRMLFAYTDPSRQIKIGRFKSRAMVLHMVKMHHFSVVRRDYAKKLRNSASCLSKERQKDYVEANNLDVGALQEQKKVIEVENIFEIRL